ncbi:MAG: hypothetical protein WCI73_00400 [Phycisphaerae bacterium]
MPTIFTGSACEIRKSYKFTNHHSASRIAHACRNALPLEWLESRLFMSVSQDVNGWTVFDQTGSDGLKVYVSSSTGNDSTGVVGDQAHPYQTLAGAATHLRAGHGDWMLLKKGDTWVDQSLPAIPDGQSADYPTVVTSYGSTGAQPLIEPTATGDFYADTGINHAAFVDLAFYDYRADPNNAAYTAVSLTASISLTGSGSDFLLEGCSLNFGEFKVQGSPDGVGSYSDIRIRRNEIMNSYGTSAHAGGVFSHNTKHLLVEGNYFEHNGWNAQVSGAEANVFNHACTSSTPARMSPSATTSSSSRPPRAFNSAAAARWRTTCSSIAPFPSSLPTPCPRPRR